MPTKKGVVIKQISNVIIPKKIHYYSCVFIPFCLITLKGCECVIFWLHINCIILFKNYQQKSSIDMQLKYDILLPLQSEGT